MASAPSSDTLHDLKRNVNAPCVFLGRDERNGEKRMFYPAVNCGFGCDACGWNPIERRRRMKTGKMVEAKSYISPVTGKKVELPEGTMQLRFRQNRE
jgi:hypothetical protein